MEHAVNSLASITDQYGDVMSRRQHFGSWSCGRAVMDRLDAAWKSAWEKHDKLRDVFQALAARPVELKQAA